MFKDITGKKKGSLRVLKYLGNSKWKCICEVCGNILEVRTCSLNKLEETHQDGCKHCKPINIGDTFANLTVISPAKDYIKPKSKRHERQWLCECICGREKVILESNLKAFKSTSCGKCSNQISIPEKMIDFYLKKYFSDIIENYRPSFLKKRELDIFIPSLKVGIEYDGERWHKSAEWDLEKDRICKEHGIVLIRIREPKCKNSEMFKNVILTPKPTTNGTHMTEPIKELINFLNVKFGTNIVCDVDCLRDNAEICKTIYSSKGFNSLEYKRPDLAKEWDYKKNYPLKPSDVLEHTGKKAYWICPRGHSYSSVIASRTGKDACGCPVCSNKGMALYREGKYIGEHSLLSESPELAKEFDEMKNGISPNNIAVSSNKKMWWKCQKCGYEWQSKVNNRTSSLHTGCPNCAKNENKNGKKHHESNLAVKGSLLINRPDLVKEWDYTKNNIKPEEVTVGQGIKVWWICPKGHSYCASINHRTNKKQPTGCPQCKNPNAYRKISQYSKNGDFLAEFSNLKEARKSVNLDGNKITACCLNKRKSAGGYIWKFSEQ